MSSNHLVIVQEMMHDALHLVPRELEQAFQDGGVWAAMLHAGSICAENCYALRVSDHCAANPRPNDAMEGCLIAEFWT